MAIFVWKDKSLVAKNLIPTWSVTMALRISAACRHWSQSVLRERKWIPDEWFPNKRRRVRVKSNQPSFADPTADAPDASDAAEAAEDSGDSEMEEPPDPEANEIKNLKASLENQVCLSEFLDAHSQEFESSDFLNAFQTSAPTSLQLTGSYK